MKKLDEKELATTQGGLVDKKTYCATLLMIMQNNDLDQGAMEGAMYGWDYAGCGN